MAAQRRGYRPNIKLHLEAPAVRKAEQLRVKLNGTALTGGKLHKGWIDFPVPPAAVKQGVNDVEILADPAALTDDDWSIIYDGNKMPQRPWKRDKGSQRTHEQLAEGSLFIADRGEVPGDYLYYRFLWGARSARANYCRGPC